MEDSRSVDHNALCALNFEAPQVRILRPSLLEFSSKDGCAVCRLLRAGVVITLSATDGMEFGLSSSMFVVVRESKGRLGKPLALGYANS